MRVLFIFLIITTYSYSQKKTNPYFFNELSFSVNRTMVDNGNYTGKIGFGVGLYSTWLDSTWINLVTGISYNNTNQFQKDVFSGSKFTTIKDVDYSLHSFSVPFITRFNIGKKTKLFFETGIFAEINVFGILNGTFYYYPPPFTQASEIRRKESFSPSTFNSGFIGGIGTSIPINKIRILIKADYQFGIFSVEAIENGLLNRYVRFSVGLRKR